MKKRKKKDTISQFRGFLYSAARVLGDVNAVKKNKPGKRISRRLIGKGLGRIFFKSVLILCFSLPLLAPCHADDYILKPDTLLPGHFILYDKKGDRIGALRPDTLIKDQYILKLNEGTGNRLHFEVRNKTDGE